MTRDGADAVVARGRSGDEEARARFLLTRVSSCRADPNDTAVTRAVVSNNDGESSVAPCATPGAVARVEVWPEATSADIACALGLPRGARRCAEGTQQQSSGVKTLARFVSLGKLKTWLAVVRARKHHTAFLETTLAHRVRRASYPLAEGPVPPLGSTSTPRDRARRC